MDATLNRLRPRAPAAARRPCGHALRQRRPTMRACANPTVPPAPLSALSYMRACMRACVHARFRVPRPPTRGPRTPKPGSPGPGRVLAQAPGFGPETAHLSILRSHPPPRAGHRGEARGAVAGPGGKAGGKERGGRRAEGGGRGTEGWGVGAERWVGARGGWGGKGEGPHAGCFDVFVACFFGKFSS